MTYHIMLSFHHLYLLSCHGLYRLNANNERKKKDTRKYNVIKKN